MDAAVDLYDHRILHAFGRRRVRGESGPSRRHVEVLWPRGRYQVDAPAPIGRIDVGHEEFIPMVGPRQIEAFHRRRVQLVLVDLPHVLEPEPVGTDRNGAAPAALGGGAARSALAIGQPRQVAVDENAWAANPEARLGPLRLANGHAVCRVESVGRLIVTSGGPLDPASEPSRHTMVRSSGVGKALVEAHTAKRRGVRSRR
jgi:hypothetical protein